MYSHFNRIVNTDFATEYYKTNELAYDIIMEKKIFVYKIIQ